MNYIAINAASDKPSVLKAGFTLIEMSVVLIIVGLIVGGILVGQDMIKAAEIRATITQIEKFQTATNTFRGKFGFLPGDINATAAATFGFASRGKYAGEGDGNGIIEGVFADAASQNYGYEEIIGETSTFWVDLSSAAAGNLIDGGFNTASPTSGPSGPLTGTNINSYLPQAKLGRGNYIYVFSGAYGDNAQGTTNGLNYFGLANVTSLALACGMYTTPLLTVQQAYAIDNKLDDGFPTSGNVTAEYLSCGISWVSGVPNIGQHISASSTTCYDNGGNSSAAMQYTLGVNNGAGPNCALAFKFQ
jgi:prepilin-type N-terminal cleavage/methylation domain-containing protein